MKPCDGAQPQVHVGGQSGSALHDDGVGPCSHVFQTTDWQVLPLVHSEGSLIGQPASTAQDGIGGCGTSEHGMRVDVA